MTKATTTATKSEQAQERITAILQERDQMIKELDEKIRACKESSENLKTKIDAFAAREDFEGWNRANFELSSAAAKVTMLERKREQTEALSFVDPAETNEIIDGLVSREIELDALMSKTILDAAEKIKGVYEHYKAEIGNSTDAIEAWIRKIHPYSGATFAKMFEMKTQRNASTGKDIDIQEYINDRLYNWTRAAFLARDFTEDVSLHEDELNAIVQAGEAKK